MRCGAIVALGCGACVADRRALGAAARVLADVVESSYVLVLGEELGRALEAQHLRAPGRARVACMCSGHAAARGALAPARDARARVLHRPRRRRTSPRLVVTFFMAAAAFGAAPTSPPSCRWRESSRAATWRESGLLAVPAPPVCHVDAQGGRDASHGRVSDGRRHRGARARRRATSERAAEAATPRRDPRPRQPGGDLHLHILLPRARSRARADPSTRRLPRRGHRGAIRRGVGGGVPGGTPEPRAPRARALSARPAQRRAHTGALGAQACEEHPSCLAFTYVTAEGACWLKGEGYLAKDSPNAISGAVRAPLPNDTAPASREGRGFSGRP